MPKALRILRPWDRLRYRFRHVVLRKPMWYRVWPDPAVNESHVLPLFDQITHDANQCPCGPDVTLYSEHGADQWVTTHYALDGRKHIEG